MHWRAISSDNGNIREHNRVAALAGAEKRIFEAQLRRWWLRTLHKRWLHSYIFSPSEEK